MFLMVKALPLLGIAAGITAGLAAITDLRQRRIPNVITVPAAALGLAFHASLPFGEGWLFALAGFATGAVLLVLPYLLGGGGMGDIKLLAALGTWLGPAWILVAFATGTVVGALLTLICLITGRSFEELIGIKTAPPVTRKKTDAPRAMKALPLRNKNALPFAVPLAMGTWIMLVALLLRSGF